MENYKNVLSCSVSYRRNIKDMPFVKMLTDSEQSIGVTRSLSEIFGDDYEFRTLKNLPLSTCKLLEEDNIITANLIENKDISAYGKNYVKNAYLYINEQDHIRIKVVEKGYNLEKCYKLANEIDDKILDKLEMAFSTTYGFLTSNPNLSGTGMQIEVVLFLPALTQNEKLAKIQKELLKDEYDFVSLDTNKLNPSCPFIKLKNKYTFGYKENEFAENINRIVAKLCELENLEENTIFDFSASHLVDKIFRAYGILKNAYRLEYNDAVSNLALIQWGINLKVLKTQKQYDILNILCKIKEEHLNENNNQNIKGIEKSRARFLTNLIETSITKGEVDV